MTGIGNSSIWEQKHLMASLIGLALATLLVYGVSFFNGFVLDDEIIIVNNPQTLSLKNIPGTLLTPDIIKPYYRPLNRATYLFDYQVAGMEPIWYHAVNIVIHVGNVLLLYLLCCRLLSNRMACLVVALLFGVHPVNSEAVNFISTRNTLLALFFSLGSLIALMRSRDKGRRWPVLSAFLLFCGLLSKETAITLIPVIALYSLVPLPGREERQEVKVRLLGLVPYLLLTALYFVMRAYSLQGIMGTAVSAEGLFSRLAQNYHIIPQYLALLLVPLNLTLFHSVPHGGVFTPFWHFIAWLALIVVIVLVVRSRNRVALFCLAWSVINYAPIANIVPIPSDQITERYLYMPAVGFFIACGVLFSWIHSLGRDGKAIWVVTALIIAACSTLTIHRSLEWRNNISLFSSAIRKDPMSPAAHYNLGTAFRENGDLASARREWETTLAIDPNYADALTQMGTLAAVQGDLQRAEQYYIAALRAPIGVSDPDKSMAYYNLGKIYEKRHQPELALRYYQEFLAKVPITYLGYKAEVEQRMANLRAASH